MSHPIDVTQETFELEVMQSELPVVIDLWATWCGPCRAVAPLLEELATKYDGKVKVVKIDVDSQPELAAAFEVESIPTMAVMYKGGLAGKVVGFGGRAHVEEIFRQVEQLPTMTQEAPPEA
jgi:thioredoxin